MKFLAASISFSATTVSVVGLLHAVRTARTIALKMQILFIGAKVRTKKEAARFWLRATSKDERLNIEH